MIVQIFAPGTGKAKTPPSHPVAGLKQLSLPPPLTQRVAAGTMLLITFWAEALLALTLALERLAVMIEARTLIIAITKRSSIKVKPLFLLSEIFVKLTFIKKVTVNLTTETKNYTGDNNNKKQNCLVRIERIIDTP